MHAKTDGNKQRKHALFCMLNSIKIHACVYTIEHLCICLLLYKLNVTLDVD